LRRPPMTRGRTFQFGVGMLRFTERDGQQLRRRCGHARIGASALLMLVVSSWPGTARPSTSFVLC
jgi:hypothetical protein